MKRGRFTEEQIIAILREAESGTPVKELCRRAGIRAFFCPTRACHRQSPLRRRFV